MSHVVQQYQAPLRTMNGNNDVGMSSWLANYCLEAISQDTAGPTTERQSKPHLVQILSRGGNFWQCTASSPNSDTTTAWLEVTDGEYCLTAHLSTACQTSIYQQVFATPPGTLPFWEYSRGAVGLLHDYQIQKVSERPPEAAMFLLVHAWEVKPGLRDMLVQGDPEKILPIHQNIAIRQARQTDSTMVLGNVQEAVQNPTLWDEIFTSAQRAVTTTTTVAAEVEHTTTTTTLTQPEKEATQEGEESSDDEDEPMLMRDMLATQPDANVEPTQDQQDHNEATKAETPKRKDSQTQVESDSQHGFLTQPIVIPMAGPNATSPQTQSDSQQEMTSLLTPTRQVQNASTQTPRIKSSSRKRKATSPSGSASPSRKRRRHVRGTPTPLSPAASWRLDKQPEDNYSCWQTLQEQLTDTTVTTIAFPAKPHLQRHRQTLQQGLSRWLHIAMVN